MTDLKETLRLSIKHPIHIAGLSFISLAYSASLSSYTVVSSASQVLVIGYVTALAFIFFNATETIIIISLLIFLSIFQGVYSISFVILVVAIMLSPAMDRIAVAKTTLYFAFLYSTLSIINFYGGFTFLFEPTLYENYFFSANRLLGLDGSPAYLSFLAGTGAILSYFYTSRKILSTLLAIFFIGVVLLTASRTAVLGLALGAVIGLARGGSFAVAIAALIALPLTATVLYSLSPGFGAHILIWLELITSHRVINWSNLLIHFSSLDISAMLFGIGKPEAITDAAILQSYTGFFLYNYVKYAESSILRILFYNGALCYSFMMTYLVFFAYFIESYKQRVLLLYFVFSAIYYDAIFSVQYIHLSFVLFCLAARKAHGVRRKVLR